MGLCLIIETMSNRRNTKRFFFVKEAAKFQASVFLHVHYLVDASKPIINMLSGHT